MAIAIGGDAPPSEFRLFVSGWNDTQNGRYLFDADAAAAVMAAYKNWGVDLAIDLEHQMLEKGIAPDPTAKDARGWCQLELRDDGSLWAVNVRWTPDGAQRLRDKRQRYISPAFSVDPESARVTQIINVAITSVPATNNTPALVAASLSRGASMDPKLVSEALEALVSGDSDKAMDLLKQLIASAAGGGADPDGDADDDANGAPSSSSMLAAAPVAGEVPDGDEGPAKKKPAPGAKDEAVATSRLLRLANTTSLVEALSAVEDWRHSHVELASERAKLAEERAVLEGAERRKLCAELVKLGAEFPATIFADDRGAELKSRWAKMPLAELRSHVADQRAARSNKTAAAKAAPGVKPPTSDAADGKTFATKRGPVTLSKRELEICKELKCEPASYAETKAIRDAERARKSGVSQ